MVLLLRLETTVISYARYLGKAFWPSKLVLPYPHPLKLYPAWQVGAAVMLLLLITVLVLRAREERYLAVGWFWFLGSLVPMIGLVQVGAQAMADRYAYISFIGLFLMIVWLVADWAVVGWIVVGWTKARQVSTRWVAIPAIACLLALGILTYRQVGYWHDTGHAEIKQGMGLLDHRAHLAKLVHRTIGFHLHDVSGAGKDHQPVGAGRIDFKMVSEFWRPGQLLTLELSPRVSVEDVRASKKNIESLM